MTTKEKVLTALAEARGEAVSGQTLADLCGVSRTAVWKAVNSLRAKGVAISGTPNGGYVLGSDSDPVNADLIKSCIKTSFPSLESCRVECLECVDSTNTYAKRLILEGGNLNKSLIVSLSQSSGRGRLGRTFVSPAQTGLYMSIIWAPDGGISKASRLTALSAVAVCRALERVYGIKACIKWINDIFYNGRKVCGILTEGVASFETGLIESAVIGIGINIRSSDAFCDAGISETAGGVLDGDDVSVMRRSELAAAVFYEVVSILECDGDGLVDEYRSRLFVLGRNVAVNPLSVNEPSYDAVAVDVDEDFSLIVKTTGGVLERLQSAEVSVRPI